MIRCTILLAVLMALALPAGAQSGGACYADYKAKRGSPLELHYGVAEIRSGCAPGAAQREIGDRIARDGWELLTVVGVFGPDGLEERRANAGRYFLRY